MRSTELAVVLKSPCRVRFEEKRAEASLVAFALRHLPLLIYGEVAGASVVNVAYREDRCGSFRPCPSSSGKFLVLFLLYGPTTYVAKRCFTAEK